MGAKERAKGRAGEAEVATIFREHGAEVRGLEGSGDHLVMYHRAQPLEGEPAEVRAAFVIHSEVKRCETARPWAWLAQAEAEAPSGAVPVVSFRRSRSRWYSIIATDDLARLLQ
jgi:hypothetical protein